VIFLKIIASILLVMFFIAGAFKANPRLHNPEYPPMAEYTAGFLICTSSVVGFYYLWFSH